MAMLNNQRVITPARDPKQSNSVGGRKSMYQIQATAAMEQ